MYTNTNKLIYDFKLTGVRSHIFHPKFYIPGLSFVFTILYTKNLYYTDTRYGPAQIIWEI